MGVVVAILLRIVKSMVVGVEGVVVVRRVDHPYYYQLHYLHHSNQNQYQQQNQHQHLQHHDHTHYQNLTELVVAYEFVKQHVDVSTTHRVVVVAVGVVVVVVVVGCAVFRVGVPEESVVVEGTYHYHG